MCWSTSIRCLFLTCCDFKFMIKLVVAKRTKCWCYYHWMLTKYKSFSEVGRLNEIGSIYKILLYKRLWTRIFVVLAKLTNLFTVAGVKITSHCIKEAGHSDQTFWFLSTVLFHLPIKYKTVFLFIQLKWGFLFWPQNRMYWLSVSKDWNELIVSGGALWWLPWRFQLMGIKSNIFLRKV